MSNTKLTVSLSADRTVAKVGETITFDSSSSTSSGSISNRTWNFGDGTLDYSNTGKVNHSFAFPGKYYVLLIIKDNGGGTAANWGSLLAINIVGASTTQEDNTTVPLAIAAADPNPVTGGKNGAIVTADGSSSMAWSVEASDYGWAASQSSSYISNMTWDFGDRSKNVSVDVSNILSSDPQNFSQDFVNSSTAVHTYVGEGKLFVLSLSVQSIHPEAPISEFKITIVLLPSDLQGSAVKNKNTFVVATLSDPLTLDPARCYDGNGGEILQNIYETLIWYNGSSASELRPVLATEVPTTENGGISADGKTYVFHIRQGVTFHDGNPMTPEDVAFSIRRALLINDQVYGPQMNLGKALIPNYSEYNNSVGGTIPQEAINSSVEFDNSAWTVTFHLVAASAPFLNYLTFTVASVVEKSYVEAHTPGGADTVGSDNMWMDSHDMGTGPYILEEWALDQYVLLDRYDNYWGGPSGTGSAKVEQVLIKNVESESTREMLLRTGDADFAYIDPNSWNGLRADSDLTVFEGEQTLNLDYIGMNQDIKPNDQGIDIGDIPSDFFSDVHVRKAFEAAFDYGHYLTDVEMGNAIRSNGPIPDGVLGYDKNMTTYSYDLEMVKRELQSTMDARDPNHGSYWDNGFTITFYVPSGWTVKVEAAQMLKSALETASGNKIHVNVVELDYYTVIWDTLSGYLPISFCGWSPDNSDPDNFVVSALASDGVWGSSMDINNATLDAMIIKAGTESNPQDRAALYHEIVMSAYDNAYYIWTEQSLTFHVQRAWIHGYYYNPMFYGLYYYSMEK